MELAAKKPKELPPNASTMHPCMLLTYMRPHLEYRELCVEGDRPQNMLFTMGVDVDGATYIGKGESRHLHKYQHLLRTKRSFEHDLLTHATSPSSAATRALGGLSYYYFIYLCILSGMVNLYVLHTYVPLCVYDVLTNLHYYYF